ncbi:hypothetical protein CC80DRAFT_488220 [Byssothecium circinans]|uniref:Uncharacterized protein n=1 Tax=Byssothecium circinans TaxID=147558 RepID=A0A6A5UAT4_9PLEO|nr:hypothetical protein CC80DRAFT_488220 [Byssothecium circinans]
MSINPLCSVPLHCLPCGHADCSALGLALAMCDVCSGRVRRRMAQAQDSKLPNTAPPPFPAARGRGARPDYYTIYMRR